MASAHRPPAVAGAFYPAGPGHLRDLVGRQLAEADRRAAVRRGATAPTPVSSGPPIGLLVPHAGLEYSGLVAAAAWHLLVDGDPDGRPLTIVILGTNHRAAWLNGLGAWERGSWHTPLGDVEVDDSLAGAVVALGPPFRTDREAHLGEHSIEVQLPFVSAVAPRARIVPLAVSTGIGPEAVQAGTRLGELLVGRTATAGQKGERILLAISTDMAHYPTQAAAEAVTSELLPAILGIDPEGLAERERRLRESAAGLGIRGLACGMCGIEPAVVGLAALRAMGARGGTFLGAATSADAGGPPDRTVGYLAVRFD
jgi:hypothetical protein